MWLHEGEWDLMPPIYDKITEDGRTRSSVRDAMELEYHSTTMVSEIPSVCVPINATGDRCEGVEVRMARKYVVQELS